MQSFTKPRIFGIFHDVIVTFYTVVGVLAVLGIFLQLVFYPFTDYAHSLSLLNKSQRDRFVATCPDLVQGCVSAKFTVSDFTSQPVGPKWQWFGLAIKLDLQVKKGSSTQTTESARQWLGPISVRYVSIITTEVKS